MKISSLRFFSILLLGFSLSPASAEIPNSKYFKVETLVKGLSDAMEITILPDGDVLIVERTGALKLFSAKTNEVTLLKTFDVASRTEKGTAGEAGLLGVTIDPKFKENGWIYFYYSAKEVEEHRLARFTYKNGKIGNEKILLRVGQDRQDGVCHEGGSLAFDSVGNLFLSTGDNTNPFKSGGYAPLDERKGKEQIDSQRSAGNTNDLRGKILRIKPTDDGSYIIPEGNLFPEGTPKTRPEIFVMGCRNPWRIGVDQRTNTVYWGDVGPDSSRDGDRGPRGYCEINQAATAGNYGWPYFVADSKPYADFDFATKKLGEKFDPAAPVNHSPSNTGINKLPPTKDPLWFVIRSCYCAGPVYYSKDYPESKGKFPEALDSCLITYDWNNGRMQLTKLKSDGSMEWKKDFLAGKRFIHPSDVEVGPDGSMYVLEYGSGWRDNTNGTLKRVTFSSTELAESESETEKDKADPRLVGLDMSHPGAGLLAQATCLSCHQTESKSVGPRYVDVAKRYKDDEKAAEKLANKIIKGGVGAWGKIPMPPHPQYNEEQVSQMVDAILSLGKSGHKK